MLGEEIYQCLTPDVNIALDRLYPEQQSRFVSVSLLGFTMGMFPVLDSADINNMNVSVTVKARISWVFIRVLSSSTPKSRKDIAVLWSLRILN